MPAEFAFEFDPFELAGVRRPKKSRDAMDEIAKYVEEKVIEYCGDGKSPVAGGEWKRTLSKEYKKRKVARGGNPFADLILEGDMLKATSVVRSGKNLKLRTAGKKESLKAEGHNTGNVLRQYIPEDGGTFKREILDGIRDIASKYADDSGEGDDEAE